MILVKVVVWSLCNRLINRCFDETALTTLCQFRFPFDSCYRHVLQLSVLLKKAVGSKSRLSMQSSVILHVQYKDMTALFCVGPGLIDTTCIRLSFHNLGGKLNFAFQIDIQETACCCSCLSMMMKVIF